MRCLRARDEGADVMRLKRANVCWPMVFAGGFRLREADAETDGKCHRGQARPGAAGGGRTTLIREMRVFPPLALTVTKQSNIPTLMRGMASLWLAGLAFRESCGGCQTDCEGAGLAGRMMADVTSGGRQTRQTQSRL